MRVVDHEPNTWFLLEADGDLVLDVYCSHSFISYSFTMLLNTEERNQFKASGREYISALASEIQYSAPIASESNSPFESRNTHEQYAKCVTDAIAEWRNSKT